MWYAGYLDIVNDLILGFGARYPKDACMVWGTDIAQIYIVGVVNFLLVG